MSEPTTLTTTELIAAATEFLADGGYQLVANDAVGAADGSGVRLFEDPYGVVALAVFETWEELVSSWPDAQGVLVAVMSEYVPSAEAKSWEGYLVLLAPGGDTEQTLEQATSIRYDMTRVRKLVASGSELQTLSDVERVLRPLLPLEPESADLNVSSALDLLPDLLQSEQVPRDAVVAAIDAFRTSASVIDALHAWRDVQ